MTRKKTRERGGSLENIKELLKRKREGLEEEKRRGEEGKCFTKE